MLSSAYAVADLGSNGPTLQPADINVPLGINNQGEVVGFLADNSRQGGYAFLYSNGVETRLSDTYRNFPRSAQPAFITDNGMIVGVYHSGRSITTWEDDPYSFFSNSFPVQIPLFDAFSFTIAGHRLRHVGPFTPTGADASGDIVGADLRASQSPRSYHVAAVFDGKHLRILGSRRSSQIFGAMNSSGQAVLSDSSGNLFLYDVHTHAMSGSIGHLNSDQSVSGINSAGAIIVNSSYNSVTYAQGSNAVLLSGGQTTELGSLGGQSTALGINESGQIVGTSALSSASVGNNPYHGFIFANGHLTDLNTLAPPSETGWTILRAEGINNAGQIVAVGESTSDFTQHALLLTPS